MSDDVKRISTVKTIIAKRVFPTLWVGVMLVAAIAAIAEGALPAHPMAVIAPLVMASFGVFLWWLLASDLADEVLDYGDHLIVKRGRIEDIVYFSDIIQVDASNSNPSRVTLHLKTTSKFGPIVAFSPVDQRSLNPFVQNPLVEELILRARNARSIHAG